VDPFEFIMVLVSIIMGLGITTLLRGVVRALRPDTTTAPGLVHAIWVAWVFVMHVGVWSGRWALANRPLWTLWDLLGFLLVPILLFALAELTFPLEGVHTNLTDYYYKIRSRFFPVAVALMVAMIWSNTFLFDHPLNHFANLVGSIAGAIFLSLAWASNKWVHFAGSVLILVATLSLYGSQLTVAAP
jgi:type III secretory pathway component EscS